MVQCDGPQGTSPPHPTHTHTVLVLQEQPRARGPDTPQGSPEGCAARSITATNALPPRTHGNTGGFPLQAARAGLVYVDLTGEPFEGKGRDPQAVGLPETKTLPQRGRLAGATAGHPEDALQLLLSGACTAPCKRHDQPPLPTQPGACPVGVQLLSPRPGRGSTLWGPNLSSVVPTPRRLACPFGTRSFSYR